MESERQRKIRFSGDRKSVVSEEAIIPRRRSRSYGILKKRDSNANAKVEDMSHEDELFSTDDGRGDDDMDFDDDYFDYSFDENAYENVTESGPYASSSTVRIDLRLSDIETLSDDEEAVERFLAAEEPDSDEPVDLEYLEQKPIEELELAEVFFTSMEYFPNIEEIEKEIMPFVDKRATITSEEVKKLKEVKKDKGRFVDPLGQEEISELDVTEQSIEEEFELVETTEDFGEEEYQSEESIFLELFELDRETDSPAMAKKVEYMDSDGLEILQQIIDSEPLSRRQHQAHQAEIRALKVQAEKHMMDQAIVQFLNDIVGVIVHASEQLAEKQQTANRVDKRRMLREILRKQRELEVERKHLYLLERRVIEHLKKKKQFRALADRRSMEFPQEEQRFERNIKKLDFQMSMEIETSRLAREQKAKLRIELEQRRAEILEKVQFLEATMRRIVTREDRFALRQAVNRSIALLAHEREALRKLRIIIIKKQDIVATLLNRIEELETLGNGIVATDFERMRTKTFELSKKVDDREHDLHRMRFRFTSSLHTHAHLRERSAMVTKALQKDCVTLEHINEAKVTLKKKLYNLKLNHLKIKKRINEISYQCGLLDKDSLMREYDLTNDVLQEKRARNAQLRKQLKDLQAKVDAKHEELGLSG